MPATKFTPRPGPPLAELRLIPHEWASCRGQVCPLPKSNRVHSAEEIARWAEATEATRRAWARHDSARLGERDE